MKYLNVNDCKAKLMIERALRKARAYGINEDAHKISERLKLPLEQVERIIKKMEAEKNVKKEGYKLKSDWRV